MTELRGTTEQQLIFLTTHWGRGYTFTAPQDLHGTWTAQAKFGQHDELRADTSSQLLQAVRDHYQANRPG